MKLQTDNQRLIHWTCFPYRLAPPAPFYTVFQSEFDTHVNLLTQIFKCTTNADYIAKAGASVLFVCFLRYIDWGRYHESQPPLGIIFWLAPTLGQF